MNARQTKIAELLSQNGSVSVQELAKRLRVTTMTIRRDLQVLESHGSLVRTHGGAVLSSSGIIEFSFLKKGEEHHAEKCAIAARVASMVHPGTTIAIDTGTTCLEVAKAVQGINDLTVLTSSLAIASALYARDNINLVLLGGTARKNNPDLSGWLTEENLSRFRVDLAVLGCDGADRDGVYSASESVARVSQRMIACAGATVLAADSAKFGTTSFLRYASWSDFDHVVTDAKLSTEIYRWLHRASKDLICAEL